MKAIEFNKGACGVIASAGSGKSTVLINRVANLIDVHNIDQREILIITFTRNTADELKKKLSKMGYDDITVGTFHSVCGRILAKEGRLITPNNMVKEWQIDNWFKTLDKKANTDDIISYISFQKNYMRGVEDEFVYKESMYTENELRAFYQLYENNKTKNNLYDFDDYLLECYNMLLNNKGSHTYEYVLVDEHQDSNLVQNKLLEELCESGNLFCVFDMKQAIYGFRGSDTRFCMDFEQDWEQAKMLHLDTNYRSSRKVVHKANEFIKKYYGGYKHYSDAIAHRDNEGVVELDTFLDRESEAINVVDEIQEKLESGVKPKEISVLYRLNTHADFVENELRRRGIEYDIANDSSFFKRKEIAGLIGYLRLIHNPHDDEAFETVFKMRNYPLMYFSNKLYDEVKAYSGKYNESLYESLINYNKYTNVQKKNVSDFEDTLNRLRLQYAKGTPMTQIIQNIIRGYQLERYVEEKYKSPDEAKERVKSLHTLKSFVKGNDLEKFLSYVNNNQNSKKKSKKNAIKLMSIHASKGLEFEVVYLIGVEDNKFPHERGELLEEARLFYVAATRSKDELYVSQIGSGNRFIVEYFGRDM
ncbi:ATP-dependent helicase [Rossellomorea marisflavi]|uniref:DNA 3'-5' helicase n=1 Tax=Rossellomorea marisflavi TaxID=189381 RepID=A0A5D4RYE5_9BACI|nr:ATP-dependent helicase [Rossellomorea marisflavi]TYS56415.1 ATP-dependent helicase [Rossellomorea marisflavi]